MVAGGLVYRIIFFVSFCLCFHHIFISLCFSFLNCKLKDRVLDSHSFSFFPRYKRKNYPHMHTYGCKTIYEDTWVHTHTHIHAHIRTYTLPESTGQWLVGGWSLEVVNHNEVWVCSIISITGHSFHPLINRDIVEQQHSTGNSEGVRACRGWEGWCCGGVGCYG